MIAFSDSRSRTERRCGSGHVLSVSDSCYSGAGGRLNNHQAAGQEEEQDSVE